MNTLPNNFMKIKIYNRLDIRNYVYGTGKRSRQYNPIAIAFLHKMM